MLKRAFTLVELIVVITILAILGTIAFISLQGYSKDTRDASRISDIGSMKKVLELYKISKSKYPVPSSGTQVSYSGAEVWTQGTFGESVLEDVQKLSNIPLDPLTKTEYTYSLLNTDKEYEIGGIFEGELSKLKLPTTNAGDKVSKAYITGTYNGVVAKVNTGSTTYVLAVPTIISSELLNPDVQSLTANNKLVYKGGNNLPESYTGTTLKIDGGNDKKVVNDGNLVIYSGDVSEIDTDEEKRLFVENIQNAYSGTEISTKTNIDHLLNTDTSVVSATTSNIAADILNNSLGANIVYSIVELFSCTGTKPVSNVTLSNDSNLSADTLWQNTDSGADCYYVCNTNYSENSGECTWNIPTSGLIAEYKFEDDTNNSISSSYNATLTSGTYSNNSKFGSKSLDTPRLNLTEYPFSGLGEFTFSAWINTNSESDRQFRIYEIDGQGDDYANSYVGFANHLGLQVARISIGNTAETNFPFIKGSGYKNITVTWNKNINSGVPKLFIDGIEIAPLDSAGRTTNLQTVSNVGLYDRIFNDTSAGVTMDQLRLYNRSLSQTEVTQLYAEGLSNPVTSLPFMYGTELASNHFNVKEYLGNDGTLSVDTGLDMQSGNNGGLVWIKNIGLGYNHVLQDTIRGNGLRLISDNASREQSDGDVSWGKVTSFNSNGFTVGPGAIDSDGVNSIHNHISWNWKTTNKTSGLTSSSNNYTSHYNPTAGFSIISYEGDSSNSHNIPHNLDKKPELFIIKDRNNNHDWYVKYNHLRKWLNDSTSMVSDDYGNLFTDSNIELNSTSLYFNGVSDYIAYAFHSVPGYSKIGQFKYNNSLGNTIDLGFEPAYLMYKNINNNDSWNIVDYKRGTSVRVYADTSGTNTGVSYITFTSNGFTFDPGLNIGGTDYMYYAISK